MESRERVVEELRSAGLSQVLINNIMDAVDEYAHERYQDGAAAEREMWG
jgi:hypothetical protein